MLQQEFSEMFGGAERDLAMQRALPILMRKVYLWMTLALAITGITAYGVAHSYTLLSLIYGSSIGIWVLIIATLALVVAISSAIDRLSLSTATLLFALYSLLNGAMLSSIFLAYSSTIITQTFLVTAGTFAAMAFIGYTTKTDLTSVGKLLLMALIGIIIASVVNIFVGSSTLDMIICYVGVLLFVGLTAYDSQKIKRMLAERDDVGEVSQKIALLGALSLYLDFINLFLYLLRIFGRRN